VASLGLVLVLFAGVVTATSPHERVSLGHPLLRVLEQLQGQLQLVLATLELLQLRALSREGRNQVLELRSRQQRHLAYQAQTGGRRLDW
jgi:hypothetical protein